jgi:hypothetical protein
MISSDIVEQWMTHLRRERGRALDAIWLIDGGAMLFDGRRGGAMTDATPRWLAEQHAVVEDVDALLRAYEYVNA